MEHYITFISEWAGLGALTPALYLLALAGPFAVLVLVGEAKRETAKRIAMAFAISGFFAYFFVCLGTGIYIGKQNGHGGLGILLGFALFISPIFGLAWLQSRFPRRLKK
jgi:hypothetical protein